MKTYRGFKDGSVTVDGKSLDPRLDLWNHSPTGFNWGYGGSGPAQLALAILADHLGDDRQAIRFHQRFKWNVISYLPFGQPWTLTSTQVDEALGSLPKFAAASVVEG